MEDKLVWIPVELHSILKHLAIDKRSTIKKEVEKILKKELINKKEKMAKENNVNTQKKEREKRTGDQPKFSNL